MKATVNKDDLVRAMKRMKPLSARAPKDSPMYRDVLAVSAVGNELMVAAGPGTGFIAAYLPAEVQEEGLCYVSYQLLELAKAAQDEMLTLSAGKRLDLRGASGFKAHMAENTTTFAFEALNSRAQAGTEGDITLRTDELRNLIDIAEAFPPFPQGNANLQWVEIVQEESGLMASIQPNEIGGLDAFPLEAESAGDGRRYILRTDLLKPILTFAGEYTKLGELKTGKNVVMVSDPNDSQWWGLILQMVYNNAE